MSLVASQKPILCVGSNHTINNRILQYNGESSSVLLEMTDGTHQLCRIFVVTPSVDPYRTSVTLRFASNGLGIRSYRCLNGNECAPPAYMINRIPSAMEICSRVIEVPLELVLGRPPQSCIAFFSMCERGYLFVSDSFLISSTTATLNVFNVLRVCTKQYN